jgi:hypothetical protein
VLEICGYDIRKLNNTIKITGFIRVISKLLNVKVHSCLWLSQMNYYDVSGGTGLMLHYTGRLTTCLCV